MNIIYVFEDIPESMRQSVILLGPSSLDQGVTAWRVEALQHLEKLGFEGTVLIPEQRQRNSSIDYNEHLKWVTQACRQAEIILFWVPRDLEKLPGLKTNVEFGQYVSSPRMIYGAPPQAQKVKYLRTLASSYDRPCFSDLSLMLEHVCQQLTQPKELYRKMEYADVRLAYSIYCGEENIPFTEEGVRAAQKAWVELDQKGDMIIGAFDSSGCIRGCLSLHFMSDLYPGYTEGPYVHIETIIVDRHEQGQGVGTALMQKAVEIAQMKNATYGIVQTGTMNISARRIFENAGFLPEGINYEILFQGASKHVV